MAEFVDVAVAADSHGLLHSKLEQRNIVWRTLGTHHLQHAGEQGRLSKKMIQILTVPPHVLGHHLTGKINTRGTPKHFFLTTLEA